MRPLKLLVAAVVVALVAGCSTTETQTLGASDSDAEHVITIAAVPGQNIRLLYVPEVEEIFAAHNVQLEVTEVRRQDVVESVTDGDYDLSYSAYVPPLLALADGADLRVVSGLGVLGAEGGNGSVLVPEDSSIKSWASLDGVSVAVASETSMSSLAVEAAILLDGGDNTVELKATDLGKIGAEVAEGKVAAGDLIEPYAASALDNYPNLVSIGDAKAYVFGKGTPLSTFYTTGSKADENAAAFAAFNAALEEAIGYGSENPDAVKEGGASQAGLSKDVARSLPDAVYSTSATAAELEPIVEVLLAVGWIEEEIDLSDFAAGASP